MTDTNKVEQQEQQQQQEAEKPTIQVVRPRQPAPPLEPAPEQTAPEFPPVTFGIHVDGPPPGTVAEEAAWLEKAKEEAKELWESS